VNQERAISMDGDDRPVRKSELRLALERALFKRARRVEGPAGPQWGISAEKTTCGRWNGVAWFVDEGNERVSIGVAGMLTPDELGSALLAAVEAIGA
jgi:hypothetical protein